MCTHSCTGQAKVSLKDGAYKRYVFYLAWTDYQLVTFTSLVNWTAFSPARCFPKVYSISFHDPRPSAPPKTWELLFAEHKKMWSGNETIECVPRLPFIEPTGKMWSERWTEGCLVFIACSSGHLTKCTGIIPRSFRWQDLGSLHSVFLRGNIHT